MHITATTVVITIAVCIIGLACWAFEALCVHLDHHDQAEAEQVYAARHDHTRPRMEPADPFSWIHTQAIVDEHRERLPASTGELRALYRRPYPGAVSETAELRALAEAGDLAGIDGILSRWASENLTEGEAA
jgi:hypothetical protein